MATANVMTTLGAVLATLLGLATALALILLSATVVRRERPQAANLLLGAGCLQMVIVLGRAVLGMLLPFLLATGGTSAFVTVNAALSMGWTLIGIPASGLLLAGIYRLATPADG